MSSNQNKVSVIIPCYNQGHYLTEAIQSCLDQVHKNVEIIVVDDGSTDITSIVCDSFKDQIIYIRQQNSGLPVARNVGILASTGAFLQFLDADDRILPTKFGEQLIAFEGKPDTGLVYSEGYIINEHGTRVERANTNHPSGWVVHDLLTLWGTLVPAPLIRRECLAKIGLFTNDAAIKGCEDADFWLRLAMYYPFFAMPQFHFEYRVSNVSMSQNGPMMYTSAIEVIRRHGHPKCKECLYARYQGKRRWKTVISHQMMAQARSLFINNEKSHACKNILFVLRINPAHILRLLCPGYLKSKITTLNTILMQHKCKVSGR